jgi:lysophospholipase L1-like esterase
MSIASTSRKIALFLGISLAFLVLGEGVLRLFHFHQIIRYTADPDLPFILAPNQKGYTEIGRHPVTVNHASMRGPEVSRVKPPGTRRILFLGDSVTFGDGVPEAEIFVRRLEVELSARQAGNVRFEVLNGSAKGYNNEHEYRFLQGRGLALDPDVVLVGYCVNDQMPSGGSGPWVQAFSPKFEASGALRFVRQFVLYVGTYRLIRTIAGAFKGLPPFYLEFIRPGEPTQRMKEWWEASAASLSMIADLCRRNGIAFGVVAFPIGPQLSEAYDPETAEPQGRLRALCEELEILYIDLLGPLRAGGDREIFFDEIHLTSYGHEIAAREMVRRLENVIPVPGNRSSPISRPD